MNLADGRRIEVFLKGTLEQRGDHFAAYIKGLGITGYAPTAEEARERATMIAKVMFSDIEATQGTGAVFDRLDRSDVEWRSVESEGTWDSSLIINEGSLARVG